MASAVVPAAGAATRFGGDKLVADVQGRALLDWTIGALLDGGVGEVIVVVPPANPWAPKVRAFGDSRVRVVVNPDPARGMFSSITLGLRAVTGAPAAVLPGDMPFVRGNTVRALFEAAVRTGGIVVPRYRGRRGHPIVLSDSARAQILEAADPTLRDALRRMGDPQIDVDVDDPGVLRDVNVKEDLPS